MSGFNWIVQDTPSESVTPILSGAEDFNRAYGSEVVTTRPHDRVRPSCDSGSERDCPPTAYSARATTET
jgi:hypothetical protein